MKVQGLKARDACREQETGQGCEAEAGLRQAGRQADEQARGGGTRSAILPALYALDSR